MRYNLKSFFISAAFLLACSAHRNIMENDLKAIRVTQTFPLPDFRHPGKVIAIDTSSIDIYFYRGLRAYILPPGDYDSSSPDSLGSLRKRGYFIRHEDSTYGWLYDGGGESYLRVHEDTGTTVPKKYALHFKGLYDSVDMKFLERRENPDGSGSQDHYFFVGKSDTSNKGALDLHYSNSFDDIPFHLSNYADSLRKDKLHYCRTIFFASFIKWENVFLDTLVMSMKMEKIEPVERNKVMHYFQSYIKGMSH